MTDLLLCYIVCESYEQARNMARHLLDEKLCACVNILSGMQAMCFWPPDSGKIVENEEVVLLVKTLVSKYPRLEAEVIKIHSYEVPCILAIPVAHVAKKYYEWVCCELE